MAAVQVGALMPTARLLMSMRLAALREMLRCGVPSAPGLRCAAAEELQRRTMLKRGPIPRAGGLLKATLSSRMIVMRSIKELEHRQCEVALIMLCFRLLLLLLLLLVVLLRCPLLLGPWGACGWSGSTPWQPCGCFHWFSHGERCCVLLQAHQLTALHCCAETPLWALPTLLLLRLLLTRCWVGVKLQLRFWLLETCLCSSMLWWPRLPSARARTTETLGMLSSLLRMIMVRRLTRKAAAHMGSITTITI